MTPPSGEPRPNPVDLIREENLRNLAELSDVLVGDWCAVAAGARLRRERELDGLRTFIPDQLDAPAFEPEAVGAYVDRARRINNGGQQWAGARKLRREKLVIDDWAASYVRRPDTRRRLTDVAGYSDLDSLSSFFAANLYQFA